MHVLGHFSQTSVTRRHSAPAGFVAAPPVATSSRPAPVIQPPSAPRSMPRLPVELLDKILENLAPPDWLRCLQTPMLRGRALQPYLWSKTLAALPERNSLAHEIPALPTYDAHQAQLGPYFISLNLARQWHALMLAPSESQRRDGALPLWAHSAVSLGWLHPDTPTVSKRTVLLDTLLAPVDLRFDHGPSTLGILLKLWPQGWTSAALGETYLRMPCAPKAHHVWSMVYWVVFHALGEQQASQVDQLAAGRNDVMGVQGRWPQLAHPLFEQALWLALSRGDPGQSFLLWLGDRMGLKTATLINASTNAKGETSMHHVARLKDPELWRTWLLFGGNVHVQDKQGVSAAMRFIAGTPKK